MRKRGRLIGGGAAVLVIAVLGIVVIARSGSRQDDASSRSATARVFATRAAPVQDAPLVILYKNPTCACCAKWAEHMRANGFRVDVNDGANLGEVRKELGVPFRLASCHTAVVGGYAIEGHVPADVISRLLVEHPEVTGLAVAGMPPGVPGMPDPGPDREPYDILAFQPDGSTHVYATR